jgi:hypothetical protein
MTGETVIKCFNYISSFAEILKKEKAASIIFSDIIVHKLDQRGYIQQLKIYDAKTWPSLMATVVMGDHHRRNLS